MTHTLTIAQLQELSTSSVVLTYNTDSADILSATMLPETYSQLGFSYGDRLILTEGERIVFSGTIQSGIAYAAQASTAEVASLDAMSDLAILERTAYCKLDDEGNALYPAVNKSSKFTSLSAFTSGIYSYASGWSGSPLTSSFSCTISKSIPAPEGTGSTPCAALITEAMRWVPDSILLQRYSAEGDTLTLTSIDALEHITLSADAPITSVSLQARPELVPPVCALIGGDSFKLPTSGDVREPGSFIYPVPVDNDDDQNRAGASPASQKMVIRGVALPERCVGTRGAAEYTPTDIIVNSRTYKFLCRFFPEYKLVLPRAIAGACLVSVTAKEDLQEEDDTEEEEDKRPPANYSDSPQSWGASAGFDAVYVMTEGQFNASSRSSKNLRGLKWCKATLTMQVGITASAYQKLPPIVKPAIETLFPGYRNKVRLAKLKLDCILINSRFRKYDPATNQPCTGDSEYTEDELTASDYRAALTDYYNASRTVYHDGSISLLHDGSLQPELLTGRSLTIAGKRVEWESMNTVVRSVTWDYQRQALSLSVGTREQLGFSDILQRRLLAKASRREVEQQLAVPFDVMDKDAQSDKETEMSVAPSISASVSGGTTAKQQRPWTLYEVPDEEDETKTKVYLAGGTLYRSGQAFNVEDTAEQITQGQPNGLPWEMNGNKLKLKWELLNGTWTYSITQATS